MRSVKQRAVILTEIIAPYRIPVFNALAARYDIDLHVIFLSENDPGLRQWHVYKNEINFSYEVLAARRHRVGHYNLLLNTGLDAALLRARPQAIVTGGYNYLASWQAAWWAKRHRVPLLLWSESNAADQRGQSAPAEFLKRRFIGMCRAFLAAGKASRDYLIELGASPNLVFIAPNAVDVRMYSTAAANAREHAAELRAAHLLPERYFLFVGRLVEEKGVFDLLAAYAALHSRIRAHIGLVFVGEGAARAELERRSSQLSPDSVRFSGWLHRERISELYALAEALVLPTHSDTWGLVVNEAMACGLPIIASNVAGCVADLVRVPQNGFTFPRGDVASLAALMANLAEHPDLARAMGDQSLVMIQSHTPEACAAGFAEAIQFACTGPTP